MTNTQLKPLAAGILIASMGAIQISAPVFADAIQEKVTVKPGKMLTPQEEGIISSAGMKVLRHIAQARSDIHNKDAETARIELGQASKLLDIIHATMPTTLVKDRIWVAKKHLEYEDTQDVLNDLVPIYSSLDDLTDIMPVKAAKAKLDAAAKQLKAGNKAKAKKALDETDSALQYTEVDLPLHTTQQLVAQAAIDLGKNKLNKADQALKSAENSVDFINISVEQPLFAAKANLYQSMADDKAGNNELVKADLRDAISNFKAARESSVATTREAANELLPKAQQMLKNMEDGNSIRTDLHGLVEKAEAYADRAVQYLATGWQHFRTQPSTMKANLIETRLRLRLARGDQFTGHNPVLATQDLDSAKEFLDKAMLSTGERPVNEISRTKLSKLQQSLKALANNPDGGDLAHYRTLEKQLDRLINIS